MYAQLFTQMFSITNHPESEPNKFLAFLIKRKTKHIALLLFFQKGDRVWFYGSLTGSYAEYCVVDEDNVDTLPLSLTFEEGAMIGTPYLTAYRALFQK